MSWHEDIKFILEKNIYLDFGANRWDLTNMTVTNMTNIMTVVNLVCKISTDMPRIRVKSPGRKILHQF